MRFARSTTLGVTVLVFLSLGGCSYYNPVGVSYEDATGTLSLFPLQCDTSGDRFVQKFDEVSIVRSEDWRQGPVLLSARRIDDVPAPPAVEIPGSGSFEVTVGGSMSQLLASQPGTVEVQVVLSGGGYDDESFPFRLEQLPRDGTVFESSGEPPRTRASFLAYLADICADRRNADRQMLFLVGAGATGVLAVALILAAALKRWGTPPSPAWPPAGWYSDPSSTEQWRWWDGRKWSDHVHPYERSGR